MQHNDCNLLSFGQGTLGKPAYGSGRGDSEHGAAQLGARNVEYASKKLASLCVRHFVEPSLAQWMFGRRIGPVALKGVSPPSHGALLGSLRVSGVHDALGFTWNRETTLALLTDAALEVKVKLASRGICNPGFTLIAR